MDIFHINVAFLSLKCPKPLPLHVWESLCPQRSYFPQLAALDWKKSEGKE